jgi:imidazolonepropionase-like amidohydrolase
MSDEQILAVCQEACAQGLRVLVHVYSSHAIMSVSQAGCTSVEHGTLIDDEALRFLAAHGTYFDPNIGVVAQNYVINKEKFIGAGGFTEESIKGTETRLIPASLEMFKRALAIQGLKFVFGTDAVAGAHGHNAEELIYRVQKGGQDASAAIVSATVGFGRVARYVQPYRRGCGGNGRRSDRGGRRSVKARSLAEEILIL